MALSDIYKSLQFGSPKKKLMLFCPWAWSSLPVRPGGQLLCVQTSDHAWPLQDLSLSEGLQDNWPLSPSSALHALWVVATNLPTSFLASYLPKIVKIFFSDGTSCPSFFVLMGGLYLLYSFAVSLTEPEEGQRKNACGRSTCLHGQRSRESCLSARSCPLHQNTPSSGL